MKNIINKNFKKKKIIISLFSVLIVLGLFLFLANSVLAATAAESAKTFGSLFSQGIGAAVAAVVGFIALLITTVLGLLITVMVQILISVAKFNNIIGVSAVTNGWVIVRDLCNMFFILILLVIAFATILRIESYNYKKTLPKLLIMAVLINFSRTICGLIVDFAQVIMLTFVNGFSEGQGYFIQMFNTNFLGKIDITVSKDKVFSNWDAAVGSIAGVIAAMITLIVLIVMVAVLVMRIIMLWIYVVLSPIAFLAAAFPAGQKYSSQWWSEFSKQVIVGPVLAFFIWLALTTAHTSGETLMGGKDNSLCAGASAFFCDADFTKFILAIGFLAGGLMVTQQMGGIAASIAGKGMDWAKKAGKTGLLPVLGAKTLGSYTIDKLHEKTGVDLNVGRVWSGIQEKREEIKRKRYNRGMVKASEAMRDGGRIHGALAMTGTPGSAWEQLTTRAGWARRIKGGIAGKEEIDTINKDKTQSLDAINKIKNSDEYQKALETSNAITPQQRHDLADEQSKLVKELDDLNKAIEKANREISLAKTSKDEVSQKIAEDELSNLQEKKKSTVNNMAENEKILSKPGLTGDEIYNAKQFVAQKDAEIAGHQKNINEKDQEILKYKPIMDFDAMAAQGALESEEMKKIDHIKDRDELTSILKDAVKNKDRSRFNAVALKLSKDGNGNDGLLNATGHESNAKGLQDLISEISTKGSPNYMGYSKQEAMALGMKLSYTEEGVNHWGTARAFKMENGRYEASSAEYQALAAVSEVAKMDPQGIARQLNRLGYGGETPDGKFVLNDYGLALIKTIGPKLAEQINRLNPNAAARLSTKENIELMIKANVAPEFIAALQGKDVKGMAKSHVPTAGQAVDSIKKQGGF